MIRPIRLFGFATSLALALAVGASRAALTSPAAPEATPETIGAATAVAPEALEAALSRQAPALDPGVLALALQSHAGALRRGLLPDPNTLTVIDYSRESVLPRFWVFDLATRRLLFEELVAHGKNSGGNLATRFSNIQSSLQSSLGLYVTLGTYVGQHGRSLRLEGLEPGINDQAGARAIVIHGADYVNPGIVARLGRLGQSWGCPALARDVAPRVIDRIRGGSAVFAYYPDAHWIASSRFLQSTPAAPAALPESRVPRAPVTFASSQGPVARFAAPLPHYD